jgi:hypothetical protein
MFSYFIVDPLTCINEKDKQKDLTTKARKYENTKKLLNFARFVFRVPAITFTRFYLRVLADLNEIIRRRKPQRYFENRYNRLAEKA